jgi:copper chaperone
MEALRLAIDGMSCGHCVRAVTKALEELPGVQVEQVSIGSASVSYDPGRIAPDTIIDAINDEGYVAYRAEAA